MNRLENLPDIANRQLGGLQATPTLLCKIKLEAADQREKRRVPVLKPILAVCAALVLCVGATLAIKPQPTVVDAPEDTLSVLDSYSAGGPEVMCLEDSQSTGMTRSVTADVPKGSISMSAGKRRAAGGSLFAQSEGSGFPLVSLNGATYRLLESPDGVSHALLGDMIGVVSEFNVEPALGSGGVVSNTVAVGEPVYAVSGMGGSLVSAAVDGAMRIFQRVSYAGTAVIGKETLEDTLCAPAQVAWLEIDGLGRAEGESAQALMRTLLSCAEYQSTAASGSTSMQVGLQNGLVLQLMTGEDSVSACGTWSCPDFFEAFLAELP